MLSGGLSDHGYKWRIQVNISSRYRVCIYYVCVHVRANERVRVRARVIGGASAQCTRTTYLLHRSIQTVSFKRTAVFPLDRQMAPRIVFDMPAIAICFARCRRESHNRFAPETEYVRRDHVQSVLSSKTIFANDIFALGVC